MHTIDAPSSKPIHDRSCASLEESSSARISSCIRCHNMTCTLPPRPFRALDIFALSVRNVIEGIAVSCIYSEVSKGKLLSTLVAAKKTFNADPPGTQQKTLICTRIGRTNDMIFESTTRGFATSGFPSLAVLLANKHTEGHGLVVHLLKRSSCHLGCSRASSSGFFDVSRETCDR